MDVPIFVIGEWATLLLDIHCPEVVLNLAYLSIFHDWLHCWVLILYEGYDHRSVAVLTVTVHSSFVLTFIFLKICCFPHWIQSFNLHFYVTLYYNGCLYICDS